jgi:hypothetical protein
MVTNYGDLEMDEYDATEKEVFSIVTEQIKDYDTSEENQATKRLADAVVAFCTDKCSEDGFDIKGVLDFIFGVIVDIASFVSHDDAAQNGLVQCLLRVQKHDDLQPAIKEVGSGFSLASESKLYVNICLQTSSWDDVFPALAMVMREKWLGESRSWVSVCTLIQHHGLIIKDVQDPTDIEATSDATDPTIKESFRR